jgi:hypothetical protein
LGPARQQAARHVIATCAQAEVVLERCASFLECHTSAQVRVARERALNAGLDEAELRTVTGRALLPQDGPVSQAYLHCFGKWTDILLRYGDMLLLVLACDAVASRDASAAVAPAGTAQTAAAGPVPVGDDVPAEPGGPLPVPADLAAARPADCRTRDGMCQEGPSEGSLLRRKSLFHCDFPSARLGYDEPSFGHPADPSEPPGWEIPNPKHQIPTKSQAPDPKSQTARPTRENRSPLPVPANLAVARTGDRRTSDTRCEEGPSERTVVVTGVISTTVLPPCDSGYDEPSLPHPADRRERATLTRGRSPV